MDCSKRRSCCTKNTIKLYVFQEHMFQTHMWDTIHFALVLYVCVMSPQLAINNFQSDVEKVCRTIVVAGLLVNIYIQLTTAIVDKVSYIILFLL